METPWQWAVYLRALLLVLGLASAAPLPVSSLASNGSLPNCPFCRISDPKSGTDTKDMWSFETPEDPTWYLTTDIHAAEASSPKGSHATETNPNAATTEKDLSDSRATPSTATPSSSQSSTNVSDTGTMANGTTNTDNRILYGVLAFLAVTRTTRPPRQETHGRGSRDSSIFEIIAVYDTEESTLVAQGTSSSDARPSRSLQDKEESISSSQEARKDGSSRASSQQGIDPKTDQDAPAFPSDEGPNEAPVTSQTDVGTSDSQKEGANPRNSSAGNHDIQTAESGSEYGFHQTPTDETLRKTSPHISQSDVNSLQPSSHARGGSQTSLQHEIDLNISLEDENDLHTWLYRESGKEFSAADGGSRISQTGSGSQISLQDQRDSSSASEAASGCPLEMNFESEIYDLMGKDVNDYPDVPQDGVRCITHQERILGPMHRYRMHTDNSPRRDLRPDASLQDVY
ncbi:hypothetical protein C7M84_022157 [Penaeus vannamei]|uniref:Uncharacterized protein n=1 Tax=Penaeus vannamei TaxID=6689 RepID=A0A3R7PWA1_PENVA|nr:hypothetical protein C7M84_022157 [Penaeus vannamei]